VQYCVDALDGGVEGARGGDVEDYDVCVASREAGEGAGGGEEMRSSVGRAGCAPDGVASF
jgi:hypothetical protein